MSNFLYWRNLWKIIMQIVIYKQFEKNKWCRFQKHLSKRVVMKNSQYVYTTPVRRMRGKKSPLKISTFTVHIERLVLSKINCGLSRADVSLWPCVNDVLRLQGLSFIPMLTNFT